MKRYNLYILCILFCINCSAQIISTYAGGGTSGLGDGGQATASSLSDPGGCTFNKNGIFFVTSGTGNRIRKIDTSGIITTLVGTGTGSYTGDGGPATAAAIHFPGGIALDSFGNVYFSDFLNRVIRRIDISTGIISTICGNGTYGYSGDGGQATLAQIAAPNGICFDKFENLYIADADMHVIRKVNMDGIITTCVGNGIGGFSGDGGIATLAKLYFPVDVTSDDSGNIYISDQGNYRVRKINSTGIITTIAGNGLTAYIGDGIPATNAQIDPCNIRFDDNHNLFIGSTSSGNERVYKLDTNGIIHSIAGNGIMAFSGDGGPATNASFNGPSGIAFDKCGNLYIGDINNNRVRKVSYPPSTIPHTVYLTASPSDTICAETYITFTAHDTGGGYITNYEWFVNGTLVGGATNATYGYHPAGGDSIYCVSMSGSPCAGWDTMRSNTMHIVSIPLATPTISLSGVTVAALGSSVTINATVAGAGSSYLIHWFNNGALFATTTVPTVSYIKTHNTDSITARVVSTAIGCYDSTLSAFHFVYDSAMVVINNIAATAAIMVYPNPAQKELTVTSVETMESVAIINLVGEAVIEQKIVGKKAIVNIGGLASGVYFVRVNGQYWRQFVKE